MMKFMNKEEGFSLVEAIVAQVVLIIGALCVWNVFIAGTRFDAESEDLTVAANVAQLKMEEIMNTRFRYIVSEHPEGETYFESEPQSKPYWTRNSQGEWITSLPDGKYVISYPDGVDADPLRIVVTVLWNGCYKNQSAVSLETLVSMTPGRFRG